jgi:microsomal epoxide hydrolase
MSDAVEPFEVSVDDAAVADLRERLTDTRWPDQIPDTGWEYGADLDAVRKLCEHWRTEYDFGAYERRLNQYDQYTTTIDGQRVHCYHVESPEPDADPLLLAHGWPGSVVEFLDVIGPLTDPAAHGGDPGDAVDLVVPSLPGYGFSGPTAERGWDVPRIADAFAVLMERLGYDRFLAQGGDWGSLVVANLGADYPERVRGIHLNMLSVQPSALGVEDPMSLLSEQHMETVRAVQEFQEEGTGYQAIQSTKPQTVAYGLTDSPAGLAGWIGEKFQAWTDGGLAAVDRERLLDNLTTYWLTGTIAASMRLYYETDLAEAIPKSVDIPTGHARYPEEIYTAPRPWAERIYDIVHWTEMERGGHFAAMEVPDLFVSDLREWLRVVR